MSLPVSAWAPESIVISIDQTAVQVDLANPEVVRFVNDLAEKEKSSVPMLSWHHAWPLQLVLAEGNCVQMDEGLKKQIAGMGKRDGAIKKAQTMLKTLTKRERRKFQKGRAAKEAELKELAFAITGAEEKYIPKM